jgi:SAM-dependent methyltransferase
VFTERVADVLRKVPPVWRGMRRLVSVYYRLSMIPFGHPRPVGQPRESDTLVASTDTLNVAAERYFQSFHDPEFLMRKPFSDSESFSRHLFSLGVVFSAIGLRQKDVVLEFGAGSCWVSHFLNKFGCRTISVDVSPTALALGRTMFERDPATNWSLGPEFIAYDGHRIPLPDACCDKIVVIDAFHHVPNQREVLTEMARLLTPDGIVGMSEPGLGHAASDASKHEVEQYGVLENELVIEDLGALAKDCGFAAASIVTVSPDGLFEVPAEHLGAFFTGRQFVKYWKHQTKALLASHYILLHKGDPAPTTKRPRALRADLSLKSRSPVNMTRGRSTTITIELENPTETRWLAAEGEGWTRLGAHLYRAEPRELIDFDWLRAALPRDLGQRQSARVDVTLPAIANAGRYEVVFDLVIEGVTWFEPKGSASLTIPIVVT